MGLATLETTGTPEVRALTHPCTPLRFGSAARALALALGLAASAALAQDAAEPKRTTPTAQGAGRAAPATPAVPAASAVAPRRKLRGSGSVGGPATAAGQPAVKPPSRAASGSARAASQRSAPPAPEDRAPLGLCDGS